MASWQEELTSSSERLSHIFTTGRISDVTFVVGESSEQKRFKLHKFILSMCSDVFFTMFYGSLPETDEVQVTDIHPTIFEITMTYVYRDAFSVKSMKEAIQTYCAAEKYNIGHLRKLCADYITKNVNAENIPILYETPLLLETLQLQSKCKEILSKNTLDIVKSDNFLKAPLDMVKDLIQLDTLNIESEKELFDFVLKWANCFCATQSTSDSKEALRTVMDHFLPHIRFLAMNVEDFILGAIGSDILTDTEVACISENLVVSHCRELPPWCNSRTSRNVLKQAKHSFGSRDKLNCQYEEESNPSFQLKENHICQFTGRLINFVECTISTKNKSVTIKGMSAYASDIMDDYTVIQVIITCINLQQYGSLGDRKYKWFYDPDSALLKCMLLEPFFLRSSSTYRISMVCAYSIFKECSSARTGDFTGNSNGINVSYNLENICSNKYPSGRYGRYQFAFEREPHSYSSPSKGAHFYEIFFS